MHHRQAEKFWLNDPSPGWGKRFWRVIRMGLLGIVQALILAWGTLALYWSNLPSAPWRMALAIAFVGLGVSLLWLRRSRRGLVLFTLVFLGVFTWWVLIPASNHRAWRMDVRVLSRAVMDGDNVTITGVRNFDYRSKTEFTAHYEERTVSLSDLDSVDFFVSYWSDQPIAHTFLSFNFLHAKPICISIEARMEEGEIYAALPACFKQAELIYVVGDERDIVRLRTSIRKEIVYLYRTSATPEAARSLFRSYLDRINQLVVQPEFYHLLSNNCTTNIDRHVEQTGASGSFDIRLLLNGHVDGYAYGRNLLDTTLPFPELRARSLINPAAEEADHSPDFSRHIRSHLPQSNPPPNK